VGVTALKATANKEATPVFILWV